MLGLAATIGLYGGVASAQEVSQDDNVGDKNKQTEMVSTPKKQSVDAYDFTQEQSDSIKQRIWNRIRNNPNEQRKFLNAYYNYVEEHRDSVIDLRRQIVKGSDEYTQNLIAQFEDFKACAYWDDAGGVWTVACGNTVLPNGDPVPKGYVIRSAEQAKSLLMGHVRKDDDKIIPVVPFELIYKINTNFQGVAGIRGSSYNMGTGPYVTKDGKPTVLTEKLTMYAFFRNEETKKAFEDEFILPHSRSRKKGYLRVLHERRKFEFALIVGDCNLDVENLMYSRLSTVYATKGDPALMVSLCQDRYCEEGGLQHSIDCELAKLSQMDRRHTYAASKQSVRKAQAKAEKYAAKKKNKSSGAKSTAKTGSKASKPTNSSAPKSKMRTQARSGRGGR